MPKHEFGPRSTAIGCDWHTVSDLSCGSSTAIDYTTSATRVLHTKLTSESCLVTTSRDTDAGSFNCSRTSDAIRITASYDLSGGRNTDVGFTTSGNQVVQIKRTMRFIWTDVGADICSNATGRSTPADFGSKTHTHTLGSSSHAISADFGGHTTPTLNHVPHIGTGSTSRNAAIGVSSNATTSTASCGECTVPTLDCNRRNSSGNAAIGVGSNSPTNISSFDGCTVPKLDCKPRSNTVCCG
jgi:hypothetical protein